MYIVGPLGLPRTFFGFLDRFGFRHETRTSELTCEEHADKYSLPVYTDILLEQNFIKTDITRHELLFSIIKSV